MKKMLLGLLVVLLLMSGCATNYFHKATFDKGRDYNRLYSATLLSLNEMGYTIREHGVEDGVITGENLGKLYTASTIGVFGIVPWFYSYAGFPTMSVVLAKGEDQTVTISITESTTSSLGDRTGYLGWLIDNWDGKLGKSKKMNAVGESLPYGEASAKIIKSSNKIQVTNSGNADWTSAKVSVFDKYNKVYDFTLYTLPSGKSANIAYGSFKAADGSILVGADIKDLSGIIIDSFGKDYSGRWTAGINEIVEPE